MTGFFETLPPVEAAPLKKAMHTKVSWLMSAALYSNPSAFPDKSPVARNAWQRFWLMDQLIHSYGIAGDFVRLLNFFDAPVLQNIGYKN